MHSTTTIAGRVGNDPEVREVKNGTSRVADLRVAVEDPRLPEGNDPRWVEVSQFDDAADRLVKYVQKGQLVICEGILDAHAYVDGQGNPRVGWHLRRARIDFGARPASNSEESAGA